MKLRHPSEQQPIRKILIVEDEAIIGMALAADLEDLGYQVAEVAGSGEEALYIIKHEVIDLVLMDIKLRGAMDGIETLSRIREVADLRIIIISGNSESRTLNRMQDLKVDGFIVKPVNIKELRQMLSAIEQP